MKKLVSVSALLFTTLVCNANETDCVIPEGVEEALPIIRVGPDKTDETTDACVLFSFFLENRGTESNPSLYAVDVNVEYTNNQIYSDSVIKYLDKWVFSPKYKGRKNRFYYTMPNRAILISK